MKLTLLLASLLTGYLLTAQSVHPSVPDSLLSDEVATMQELHNLKVHARKLRRKNQDSVAIVLAHHLLRQATRLDKKTEIAEAYRLLSEARHYPVVDSFFYYNLKGLQLMPKDAVTDPESAIIWPILVTNRGNQYGKMKQCDSARYYARQALKFRSTDKAPVIRSVNYTTQTICFNREMNYDSSAAIMQQSLAELRNDTASPPDIIQKMTCSAHLQLSRIARYAHNFADEKKHLLLFASLTQTDHSKVIALSNLVTFYSKQVQYDSVYQYAMRAKKLTEVSSKALASDVLARGYLHADSFELAARHLDSVSYWNNLLLDQYKIKVGNATEAAILMGNGQLRAGLDAFRTVLQPDSASTNDYWGFYNYYWLMRSSMPTADRALLRNQLDTLYRIHETSYNNKTAEKIEAFRVRFQTAEKEKQNQLLAYQKELATVQGDRYRQIGMVLGAMGLLLFGLVVILLRKRNQLQAARQEILNLKRADLHATQGNFRTLSHAIQDATENADLDSSSRAFLLQLDRQVKGFHELQRLTQDSPGAHLDLCTYLHNVLPYYQTSIMDKDGALSLDLDLPAHLVVSRKAGQHFGVIINELVTNTGRYAKRINNIAYAQLSIQILPDGQLSVIYTDEGKSVKNVTERESTKMGLKIIKDLTLQLGGKIDQTKGFQYQANFPASIIVAHGKLSE